MNPAPIALEEEILAYPVSSLRHVSTGLQPIAQRAPRCFRGFSCSGTGGIVDSIAVAHKSEIVVLSYMKTVPLSSSNELELSSRVNRFSNVRNLPIHYHQVQTHMTHYTATIIVPRYGT